MILFFATGIITAENTAVKKANYQQAARFSSAKLKKMVFSTAVDPHWLKLSNRFWYSYETPSGKTYYIVDPVKKSKRPLFDNTKMAAEVTLKTKDPYDSQHLPIDSLKFINDEKTIYFRIKTRLTKEKEEREEKLKEQGKEEKKKDEEKSQVKKAQEEAKKYHHFEYELATGKLNLLKGFVDSPKRPDWAAISPDGETIVYGRHFKANYEKWLQNPKNESIEEHQLTTDGEEYYGFGGGGRGETNVDKEKNKDKRKPVRVVWSHDSKKIALTRTDERKVKNLWVINSTANPRPTLETYRYHMPGEEESPQYDILIFDLASKTKVQVKDDQFKDQSVSILSAPRLVKNRDDENQPSLWLSKTADKLYFSRSSRDLYRVDICVADTTSGEVKVLIEERLNTYVETRSLGFVNNGKELIHWSERDGWAHFYLFNGDGTLKNQITTGPFHCDRIQGIDSKNRVLYFTANAREKNEDPYYLHLYRVNFNGSGLKILNKENFNHAVRMDDEQLFFVNNFSRVDTAPQTELKNNLGTKVMDLETADLSLLLEAGYKFPETFKTKADDGITDIYGVMYKPFDFDETLKYPVIAYVYPGPQTEAVNKSFSARMDRTDRLAQFGFIVVTLGNRGGHPSRSKWYHNYGYGNLRDYGLADKKAVIEQLADRHPFINIDRVGIFGHSGGGFMSTAAMLVYPDFFKVAVSSAGNHENNIYNRWWSEKHHGVKEVKDKDGNIKFEYDIQKNSELAKNLKGRLLICTGDIDNNVHPGNTIRLANALIKANKRFDFFIFPGQRHGFGNMNEYFFWLRADYFCQHLIGDYTDSVDMVEMNRDKEMSRNKR